MIVNILIFLVVLGVLVFFHELGHFLAAKACGIYCDRFSLGMPPRIFGLRIGETDYCIGLLPIGGYVKMAGQEDVPQSEEERQEEYGNVPPDRWFSNKPVWQRAIVIVAGPLMNLVLAVLLYAILLIEGTEVSETKFDSRVGYVEPKSAAATAPLYRIAEDGSTDQSAEPDAVGWETGDRILSVAGEEVENIVPDVMMAAILHADEKVEVKLERAASDGSTTHYLSPVTPKKMDGEELPRFGIAPYMTGLVDEVLDGFPARAAGLKKGDVILRANGMPVDSQTFSRLVSDLTDHDTINIEVEREGTTLELALHPRVVGRIEGAVFDPPLHEADPEKQQALPKVVAAEGPDPEAPDKPCLLRRDVVTEINGQPATTAALRDTTLNHPGETVTLTVQRPPLLFGLVRPASEETIPVRLKPVGQVGVSWQEKTIFYRPPLVRVLPESIQRAGETVSLTLQILRKLLTFGLSPKNLGGPIQIFETTTQAAHLGRMWLFETIGLISINLCIFNLLPLPVLDGGQIVFLIIEKIQRRPVSQRVAIVVQQIGLVLIIGLMLFVTYNDLMRALNRMLN